jgi:hypothetical protein
VKGLDPIWLTVIATVVAIDQWIGSGKVSLDHVFPANWIPWLWARPDFSAASSALCWPL